MVPLFGHIGQIFQKKQILGLKIGQKCLKIFKTKILGRLLIWRFLKK